MKNEKMTLNHMILYCKGWYKRSNCVWKDLSRCMVCDGHFTPFNKNDVAYLMLRYIELHIERIQKATGKENMITYLYGEIRNRLQQLDYVAMNNRTTPQKNCCSNYDEAVIICCIDMLRWLDTKVYDKMLKPCGYVLPLTDSENFDEMFDGCDYYDKDDVCMSFAFNHHVTSEEMEKYIKDNELKYNN